MGQERNRTVGTMNRQDSIVVRPEEPGDEAGNCRPEPWVTQEVVRYLPELGSAKSADPD